MSHHRWWPEPAAGDILWCRFPVELGKPDKPRPALVIVVFDDDAPEFHVRVAFGTSQRTSTLYRGEFLVSRATNAPAFAASGLSYDTKFDLRKIVDLPYHTEWFAVPPSAPHGQIPKLGTLHPSLMRAFQAAYAECERP